MGLTDVLRLEGVGKAYEIGEFSSGTLSKDIERWWIVNVLKKDDPFLKIGSSENKNSGPDSKVVWSLKDINFNLSQGDTLGIIGKNGAGKSTLLKVISRITYPSEGSIKIKGKISSLLEVGTGFHPELTGRENIFLNGAILGMTRFDIKQQLDEIIDFSGVERYIDTPVKRYSSGMYVRLAFAVAAHLNSDILIVDEVLAVGDLEFQNKCLGKMDEVSSRTGKTILFVSHNMQSVNKLCKKAILLEKGNLVSQGSVEDVTSVYIDNLKSLVHQESFIPLTCQYLEILGINIEESKGGSAKLLYTNSEILIRIFVRSKVMDLSPGITLILKDQNDNIVFSSINNLDPNFGKSRSIEEDFEFNCLIPKNFLNDIIYKMTLIVFRDRYVDAVAFEDILAFEIKDSDEIRGTYSNQFSGLVRPKLEWKST